MQFVAIAGHDQLQFGWVAMRMPGHTFGAIIADPMR